MSKLFLQAVFILLVIVFITGCRSDAIEENPPMISQHKMDHAIDMMFILDFMVDNERRVRTASQNSSTDPRSHIFNPMYTELIFVHSQEEAVDLPDNVVMAWPCCFSLGVVERLNEAVKRTENELRIWGGRDVLQLEEFGLSYPITVTDIVENWGQVSRVLLRLTGHERDTIRSSAPLAGINYRSAKGESYLCCFDPSIGVIR